MVYVGLIYLGTIIVTLGIRLSNKIWLTKDLSLNYYKLDDDALKDEEDNLEYFNLRKLDYKNFIPFYNIYKAIKGLIEYSRDYVMVIEELEELGIACEMAKFEAYEYQKKPNFINLFKVLRNGKKRLMDANYFETMNNDGEVTGQIFYESKDNSIILLDTSGDFSKMLTSEIIDIIKTNDDKGIFTNFMHDDGKRIVVASEIDKENDINVSNIKEKIVELKELKRTMLITSKEEEKKGFIKKLVK